MTGDDFSKLFFDALNQAAISAEARLGTRIPRSFVIQFHGLGFTGDEISAAAALDHLYLGDSVFFKIVDMAVISFTDEEVVVFVRVSGHSPVSFEGTWDPSGLGPFKLIESKQIRDLRSSGNAD